MQKGNIAKLCRCVTVRFYLKVCLLLCGIFFVRAFPCCNLNLVLVDFCLNLLGFVRSTGYQVRIVSEHFLQDSD